MILITLATSLGSVFAADFPDVSSSHPNYTAINFLRARGVINGYEDGTYKPNREVTRAEFLKIILLSSGNPVMAGDLLRGPFPDVPSTAWYFGFINRALALGVVSGYADGTFQPNRTVNRVEALKIMLRANNITEAALPTGTSYSDVVQTEWYAPYARYAFNNRLFDGARLNPGQMMNRAEVAEMVYRFYQARPDLLPATTTSTPAPTSTGASPIPTPMDPTPTVSATPTVTPSPSFHLTSVTNAVATPSSYVGSCPAWAAVTFSALVTTNGQAGVVAYRWERVDGSHVTNYQTLGIPSGQTATTITWSPNWNGSIHSAYRLLVMDNGNGLNSATSNYADFAIDCRTTSGTTAPTPTPTASPLQTTTIGLAYSGPMSFAYRCSPTITFGFKGSIEANGVAGTVRYYVEDEEGNRSAIQTYEFTSGQTVSSSLSNTLSYTNTATDWVKYVRRFVITPDGQTHNSQPLPIASQCSSSHAPAVHVVERLNVTANQPGWGTRYVCGRDNNYNLAGRVYLAQPVAGGDITYRWIFNTGAASAEMTATATRWGNPYIDLPLHTWTITNTGAPGTYTAWLEIMSPNVIRSEQFDIVKPRCGTL